MKVYWIKRRDQLEAVSSPIRQDIADRLSAIGPCSVATLASALGYRPTALYRHLAALRRVGLVQTLEERSGRGRPAVQYRMIAPLVRWSRAPRRARNRPPMIRAAKAMAVRAVKDYALGFASADWTIEGPSRNHWAFRLVFKPSPQRLKTINRLLDEVARLAYTPDPRPGPLVSVACLLSPVPERVRPRNAARTRRPRGR